MRTRLVLFIFAVIAPLSNVSSVRAGDSTTSTHLLFSTPPMSFEKYAHIRLANEPVEIDPPSGGTPLFTDDTGTPGDKHIEFNTMFVGDFQNDHRQFQTPLLDFNYGIGARLQLKAQIPLATQTSTTIGPHTAFGDMGIGVKYRFYEDTQTGISLAVFPQIFFPVEQHAINTRISARGYETMLPMMLTRNFGQYSIGGEVGLDLREHAGPSPFYGVTGGYTMKNNRVQLLAEVYGDSLADLSHEVLINLGTRVSLDKHKHFKLLFSVGRTVVGRDRWVGQIGIQYVR